jgi:DNA replication protein DnaC
MSVNDDLVPILKKLRLSGVLDTLELRVREACDDELSHVEFLYRLLSDEVARREAKNLHLRLRKARFEHAKTIDDFDFQFNPTVPKSRIVDLATCHFVARREVVCLVGPSGVGKSHLAQALGHRACMAGHTVLYTSAHQMFRQLRAARADRSFDRCLLRFTKPELLVLDDLGLRALKEQEPEDLYEVIRHRYERGAMVVTSNRAIEEWYPLFGDALLASAAMDRLLHHAHVLELPGKSFRNPSPTHAASAAG